MVFYCRKMILLVIENWPWVSFHRRNLTTRSIFYGGHFSSLHLHQRAEMCDNCTLKFFFVWFTCQYIFQTLESQEKNSKFWYCSFLFYLEITAIKISSDQRDGNYFIGEDATILASFGNPSAVFRITWVKKTERGDQTIDTMLPKYTGSTCSNEIDKPMLTIKNCNESDIGTYFLMAHCNNAISIASNKIDLKVVKGKIIFFKL